jgi:hypothetical protein
VARKKVRVDTLISFIEATNGEKASALAEEYGRDAVIEALKKMLIEDVVKYATIIFNAAVKLGEEWLIKNIAKKIIIKKIGSINIIQKAFNEYMK